MGAILFNDKAYPAGSNQALYSVYDNSTTGLPATTQGAIDKTTDNIASANSVELTATAAHAHAVGTYFIWIGQFVKVTSAIAVGDTIADGTNVEATSIADVLAAANGAIEGKLSPSDVVNNLTSTATNLPLSAAMGKALNDAIFEGSSTSIGYLTGNGTQYGQIFNISIRPYKFICVQLAYMDVNVLVSYLTPRDIFINKNDFELKSGLDTYGIVDGTSINGFRILIYDIASSSLTIRVFGVS